nr:MAG TPA: hypothetical protein [Caudoviricetes sp.]
MYIPAYKSSLLNSIITLSFSSTIASLFPVISASSIKSFAVYEPLFILLLRLLLLIDM